MSSMLPAPSLTIIPTPLTAESFSSFGSVILTPLPSTTTTLPQSLPPESQRANQNTALKYSPIAPSQSIYHQKAPSLAPASHNLSLFACFPRSLRPSPSSSSPSSSHQSQQLFDIRILERHPYTTQTFIPLASATPPTSKAIIIVAPTLPTDPPPPPPPPFPAAQDISGTPYFPQKTSEDPTTAGEGGLPDLRGLRAFIAEPGVGVSYAAGTWHSPMVVVGRGRIDFVVSQWMNGRARDDCQEVELEAGLVVALEVGPDGQVQARTGLWRPKL